MRNKLLGYGLVLLTVVTTLYTFSRGGPILLFLVSVAVLAVFQEPQAVDTRRRFCRSCGRPIVPTAVQQRISMTKSEDGHLEASAEERVDLWKQSRRYVS